MPEAESLQLVASQLGKLIERMDALASRCGVSAVPQLYTVGEAAKLLCIKPSAVERLLRTGQLAWINVSQSLAGGKPRKRIREQDISAFVAARIVKPFEAHASRRGKHTF